MTTTRPIRAAVPAMLIAFNVAGETDAVRERGPRATESDVAARVPADDIRLPAGVVGRTSMPVGPIDGNRPDIRGPRP